MLSNTAREGVDPAGAFSPAANEVFNRMTWRWALGLAAAFALTGAAVAWAVL